MKRLLIISYVFPPTGGAGVQRVLKFVKYLGTFGWEPVVVTPKNPSTPLKDDSHYKDLPNNLKLYQLPIINPTLKGQPKSQEQEQTKANGYKKAIKKIALSLLFPDHQMIWLFTALPGLLKAIKQTQPKAVLVTGPPFSTFILGAFAAQYAKLPLILDFRDEWSGFFTKGFKGHTGGKLWRYLVERLEHKLVEKAGLVIGNTPEMTRRLMRLHGGPKEKYHWIPNGYDAQDFDFLNHFTKEASSEKPALKVLYTGTVFESHPLDDFFEGVKLLTPQERKGLCLEVVGRVVEGLTVDPKLEGFQVKVLPYEPHEQVLKRMAQSDVLLMTMADLPGLERMVPAKLYEYLAVLRPILAIAPKGAASAIVQATNSGKVSFPGDPQGLSSILRTWLAQPPTGLESPPIFFERRRLTGELALLLDRLN